MNGNARNLLTALSRSSGRTRARQVFRQSSNHEIYDGATSNCFSRLTYQKLQTRMRHTSDNGPTKAQTDRSPPVNQEPLEFPDPRDPKQHPLADLSIGEVLAESQIRERNKAQQKPPVYRRKVTEVGEAYAIGRRKESEAKVWLREGTGVITINDKPWLDYFPRVDHRDKVLRPLDLLGVVGRFDIRCRVYGGGANGQTEAVRHGIARALQNWDPHMRPSLKQDGLLTRDSRAVEPKKYGRKKARKSFTWVKR